MKYERFVARFIPLAFVACLAACGGTGGSNNPNPTPTPTPTPGKVTVTCPARVHVGVDPKVVTMAQTSYQCTASEAVTWSVSDASLAAIGSTGIITPTSNPVSDSASVTVTATPTSGNDTAGTATVKVVDWIAYNQFARDAQNNSIVYNRIINADGNGGATVLTDGSAFPTWLPDHLSLISEPDSKDSEFEIFTTGGGANDGKVISTIHIPSVSGASGFTVSPDGKTVLFRAMNPTTRGFGYYTIHVDGTGLVGPLYEAAPVLGGSEILIGKPHWSPDGKRIVHVRLTFTGTGGQTTEIWTMNADGSNALQVTSDGGTDNDPAYLNANTIIFDGSQGICTIPTAGGAETFLVNGLIPTPAPSGTWFAYLTSSGTVRAMQANGAGDHLVDSGSNPSW